MDSNLNIIQLTKSNSFDYDDIFKNSYNLIKKRNKLDLNVIIPVRGRKEFLKPLLHYFIEAKKNTSKKISFTVVEDSPGKEHEETCKEFKVNYIWLKSNKIFNKCLAHNIGVLFSSKSKYLMFHDLDCLVQKDFFINVFENIKQKELIAIQCFNKRRVLYCNEKLTNSLIELKTNINDVNINHPDINLFENGKAPGGSILLNRETFFNIGGYDPELFNGYSPEDSFFWEKIETLTKIGSCDSPIVEIFHMHHPPSYFRKDEALTKMHKIDRLYRISKMENKLEILKYKSDLIKKYE